MRHYLRRFIPALLLLTASCSRQQQQAYTVSPEGFSYKLLAFGDDSSRAAADGRILLCEALLRTETDSLFFNSRYQATSGLQIRLDGSPAASGKSYLATLSPGDSVSLLVGKTCFFRAYFDTLPPYFLAGDSVVKLDLKVMRILDAPEAGAVSTEDRELEELQQIESFLRAHYPGVKADAEGLYTLEHKSTGLEPVSYGKKVRVSYNGYYLDGQSLDNGRQQIEYSYGTPDQLVRGLNIVIGRLKKGETSKIIVPSRLAFGETGSSNGSVPPYTPLLYDITLIDIK